MTRSAPSGSVVSGSTGTRLAAGKPELCSSEHIAGSQATIAALLTCLVTQRAAVCLTAAAAATALAPGEGECGAVGLALLDGLPAVRCREVIQTVPAVTPAAATTSTRTAVVVARHRRPRRCAHNRIVEASTDPHDGSAFGDRAGGRAPAAPGRAPAGRVCGPVELASPGAPGPVGRLDGGASAESAGEGRLAKVSPEPAGEGRPAGAAAPAPSVRGSPAAADGGTWPERDGTAGAPARAPPAAWSGAGAAGGSIPDGDDPGPASPDGARPAATAEPASRAGLG